MRGDQVTILKPTASSAVSQPLPPQITRIDHEVCIQKAEECTATMPVVQHQCKYTCVSNEGSCAGADLANSQVCCKQICQDVHTSDQCIGWSQKCVVQQDQWTEVSEFAGLGSPEAIQEADPMKSPQSIVALLYGLALRISFSDGNGNLRQVDCSLGGFNPVVDPRGFVFRMDEVAGCSHMSSDHPETPRELSLINQLSEPIGYPEGEGQKTWDGKVLKQPAQSIYHPEIDLSAVVTVQAGGASDD